MREKAQWLDKINVHQWDANGMPVLNLAVAIKATLESNNVPFVRGAPGARGGPEHHKWAKNLRTWYSQREKIRTSAARLELQSLRNFKKFPSNVKYPEAEKQLDLELRERYAASAWISSFWLSSRMRSLVKKIYGEDYVACRQWRRAFRIRHGWRLRVANNRKRQTLELRIPAITAYLQRFRHNCIQQKRDQCKEQWDDVWGNYPLSHRWNVYQVPLPFILRQSTTMAPRGADRVHVALPSASLAKRQATLQILVRGDGRKCKLAIIFRGQGNISDQERRMLEAIDIDVYWQKKAWADPALTRSWLARTMAAAIKDSPGEHLLTCDNLAGQDVRAYLFST